MILVISVISELLNAHIISQLALHLVTLHCNWSG